MQNSKKAAKTPLWITKINDNKRSLNQHSFKTEVVSPRIRIQRLKDKQPKGITSNVIAFKKL